jgi:hypothetical protein
VPEQPRDLTDLSGSDHAPRDVAKRANEGVAYVPTPVIQGAVWRVLGLVAFTVYDRGGGIIDFLVHNGLQQVINVSVYWSYAGVTRVYNRRVLYGKGATVSAHLPEGFDGTLELMAQVTQ